MLMNECNFEGGVQVRNVIIKFILMKYMHIYTFVSVIFNTNEY